MSCAFPRDAAALKAWYQRSTEERRNYPYDRIKEAAELRSAAQDVKTAADVTTLYSTADLEHQWTEIYTVFCRFVFTLQLLLQGYLTCLEVDFSPLDSFDNLVAAAKKHSKKLILFGAHPALGDVLEKLKPYWTSEPTDNFDRGAFVSLVEAMWRSMPFIPPIQVRAKIEALLGHKVDGGMLAIAEKQFRKPSPSRWMDKLAPWSKVTSKPNFDRMMTFIDLLRVSYVQGVCLVTDIAEWKFNIRYQAIPLGIVEAQAKAIRASNGGASFRFGYMPQGPIDILQSSMPDDLREAIPSAYNNLKEKEARRRGNQAGNSVVENGDVDENTPPEAAPEEETQAAGTPALFNSLYDMAAGIKRLVGQKRKQITEAAGRLKKRTLE